MKMFVRSQPVNVEIVKWDFMEHPVMRVIKKNIFKSHFFDLSGLKNQSVNCRWIGFTALTRSKRRH